MSAALFDDTLNARLNDVPLPADLMAKLHVIPLAEDADLESLLADVPLPPALIPHLAAIADHRWHWKAPLTQAAAVLLVFAASLGYALSAVAFVSGRFCERLPSDAPLDSLGSIFERGDIWLEECSAALEPPVIVLTAPTFDNTDQPATAPGGTDPGAPGWRSSRSPLATASPPRSVRATRLSPDFASALVSVGWPTAAEGSLYDLSPIERAAVRLTGARALDSRFWRATGVLPWLDPMENRGINVPLVQSDASYRLVRQSIQSGRLPAAAAIRCEEWIAGIDYGLENETSGQPLVMAAAPSPFASTWQADTASSATSSRWLLLVAAAADDGDGQGHDTQSLASTPRFNFEFSPEHVAAYRIIGYAPPASHIAESGSELLDLDGDRSPVGHAAAVLFEMELRQGYESDDELARIALGNMAEDRARHARSENPTAVLRADCFSPDFDAAPLIWRQAALVALAAERFAGSPCAELSLGEIAALARQIEPAVYDRAGWRELILMLVHAQSLESSLLRAF